MSKICVIRNKLLAIPLKRIEAVWVEDNTLSIQTCGGGLSNLEYPSVEECREAFAQLVEEWEAFHA